MDPTRSSTSPPADRRAIVIGGSIAGLLAARVLADHYEEVVVSNATNSQSTPRSAKARPMRFIHMGYWRAGCMCWKNCSHRLHQRPASARSPGRGHRSRRPGSVSSVRNRKLSGRIEIQ